MIKDPARVLLRIETSVKVIMCCVVILTTLAVGGVVVGVAQYYRAKHAVERAIEHAAQSSPFRAK